MEWFDLVKEYEEKHGSFSNASYDDPDYVKFRVKMIMLENGFGVRDAVNALAWEVANPTKRSINKKVSEKKMKYEQEFLDVLHIIR